MRAKYCKCKNTYTMTKCNNKCQAPDYWSQGLGSLTGGTVFNKTGVIETGEVVFVEILEGGELLAGTPDYLINMSQSSTSGSGNGAYIRLNVVDEEAVSFGNVSAAGSGYAVGDTINLTTAAHVEDTIVRVTEIEVTGTSSDPRTNNNDRAGLWD